MKTKNTEFAFNKSIIRPITLLFAVLLLPLCPRPAFSAINTFFQGSSLSTNGNWQMTATAGNPTEPTASTYNVNPGASSRVTDGSDALITTTAGTISTSSAAMWVQSWNVTNGSSYILQAAGTSNTQFSWRMGQTMSWSGTTGNSTNPSSFTNEVSTVAQDLVFLTNNSNLTFDNVNQSGGTAPIPVVSLRSSGNFNIATGSTLTVNAAIVEGASGLGITKTGGGIASFNGSNTYTGVTNINAGTLKLLASGSIKQSPNVNIAAGAVLDTTAQSFVMLSTQPFKFTLSGTQTGLLKAANLDITSGTLDFDATGYTPGNQYVIATYSGTLAGSGSVTVVNADLPAGYYVDFGTGTNSQITVVPEPATLAMAVGGMGMLVLFQRMRRR